MYLPQIKIQTLSAAVGTNIGVYLPGSSNEQLITAVGEYFKGKECVGELSKCSRVVGGAADVSEGVADGSLDSVGPRRSQEEPRRRRPPVTTPPEVVYVPVGEPQSGC